MAKSAGNTDGRKLYITNVVGRHFVHLTVDLIPIKGQANVQRFQEGKGLPRNP